MISDGVGLPVAKVKALDFFAVERARAAAAEDGDLIAGFVDCPVAINAL